MKLITFCACNTVVVEFFSCLDGAILDKSYVFFVAEVPLGNHVCNETL